MYVSLLVPAFLVIAFAVGLGLYLVVRRFDPERRDD